MYFKKIYIVCLHDFVHQQNFNVTLFSTNMQLSNMSNIENRSRRSNRLH